MNHEACDGKHLHIKHNFIINWLQKLQIYTTFTHLYIVGSNNARTRFRLLEIDRTIPLHLKIEDDGVDYTYDAMEEKLAKLFRRYGGSIKDQKRIVSESQNALGIVGFVRFLEGYYIILITKKSKVAEIGGHSMYKIEDTSMIYIPNAQVRISHPNEGRYLKVFQTVDLNSNFYFSYSYDLTNCLQYNMLTLVDSPGETDDALIYKLSSKDVSLPSSSEVKSQDVKGNVTSQPNEFGRVEKCSVCHCKASNDTRRGKAESRFVWNRFLLESVPKDRVTSLWLLNVIHGYVNAACVNIYGERVHITLIGRRSSVYAGTRFLKRGCSINGDVANEVETEQIVHRASTSSLRLTSYTSFVQHRGSVPVHWMQDIGANVVPGKPPIIMTSDNPYAQSTAKHFEHMLARFGAPITVLNLVKKRDKSGNESALGREFKTAVDYLNQFLTTKNQIKYHALDMAHMLRSTKRNVLSRLAAVAENSLQATGFFQSKPDLNRKDPKWQKIGGGWVAGFRVQTGALRTNCVDCLDRTNSAQFVAGKCALAYQLYSLGIIDRPEVNFDTDITRLFEEMFEAHGDIVALQYGGSQLVHTIQSYRRTVAPWTSHSRDVITTLSRYYTNTFSDADKQSAINLFLGVYRPDRLSEPLWELSTDQYLHNDDVTALRSLSVKTYTRWWSDDVIRSLPLPLNIAKMMASERGEKTKPVLCRDCSDCFADYHRPDQLTVFDDCFDVNLVNTATRCLAAGNTDVSPFVIRGPEFGDTDHDQSRRSSMIDVVSSNESADSDGGDSSDESIARRASFVFVPADYATSGGDIAVGDSEPSWLRRPTVEDFSALNLYGIDLHVSLDDVEVYKRYLAYRELQDHLYPANFDVADESELFTSPPTVDAQSVHVYRDSVSLALDVDVQFYNDYVSRYSQQNT